MKKAVAYCRFSSDNQREESIDAQIRAIKDFANNNNINLVKIYSDEAKSATTDNRPQFLQMIDDASNMLFDYVIVHKLDRFSRNRYDSAHYKKKLKDYNIRLLSVVERLDDSPESIILESVLEGLAEYYSKNLAREVMKGMKENALKCKHTGGKPPYGYSVDENKNYIINAYEAEAIKLIYEMYANEHSYNDIKQLLNLKEYTTRYGNEFTNGALNNILTNEKYCGTYIYNKYKRKKINGVTVDIKNNDDQIIRIEDGIPAIVSKELFKEVKLRMNGNKKKNASYKAKRTYLLSGKIVCGECSSSFVGNTKHSGQNKSEYITYECSGRKRKKNCSAKAINAPMIEKIVIDELDQKIFSEEGVNFLIPMLMKHTNLLSDTANTDKEQFEIELKETEKQIKNIVDAVAAGLFNPSMKERLDALESKKNNLTIMLEEAKLQSDKIIDADLLRNYFLNIDIKKASPIQQKKLIDTYISKVTVYHDNIDIEFIVDTNNGDEGNRTPVQRSVARNFYHYSSCLFFPSLNCPRTNNKKK